MTTVVSLQDVVDALDMFGDTYESFLDRESGGIVTMTEDGELLDDVDADGGALTIEILETERFLRLPEQFDLDELSIMRNFSRTCDDRVAAGLHAALDGPKPFRRFKDSVRDQGVDKAWYAYRQNAFEEFVRAWLKAEGIPFQ